MNKRDLLKLAITLPFLRAVLAGGVAQARAALAWVRPGDLKWPSAEAWAQLNRDTGGNLLKLESPFAKGKAGSAEQKETLARLKNAFYVGDQPALTQTSGWADAWHSQPSAYAVAARNSRDVAAAIDFAREHNLRLVVKGAGHSYQGTSCAANSLLIWTRYMNRVEVHDDFVPQEAEGEAQPGHAVSVGAGAMWIDAYDAVTTRGGRYVQGGGCTTVGVAGLVQSGGFGNFSKRYGTAAAGLLEAEIVTADGKIRVISLHRDADLFWAIKGGGGGSFGVLTRLTLRTCELPQWFGAAFGTVLASSDQAYRTLIAKVIEFYADSLFNPHWGEQISFRASNRVNISLVFQGLDEAQATAVWAPLVDWIKARDSEYSFEKPLQILALPAQHFWDGQYFRQRGLDLMVADDRPEAPGAHVLWAGDQGQVGWFIHAYRSAWLPKSLLEPDRQGELADAIFACTRHWSVGFHFNKGLAGAPPEAIDNARDTATNPQMLDAFALAIMAGGGSPAFPGMPGVEPDITEARSAAEKIGKGMSELLKAAPGAGAYVSESDYFQTDWGNAFWGRNYRRLQEVKRKYDPHGLFLVHHGVGSRI